MASGIDDLGGLERRPLGVRRMALGVAFACVAVGLGWLWWPSSESGRQGPVDEAMSSTTSVPVTVGEVGVSTVVPSVAVPSSSVPGAVVVVADEVVTGAAPDLSLTAGQLECLRVRVAGVPGLLDEVGDDPQPGSEGFGVLVEAGEWCVTFLNVAPLFIEGLAESLGEAPSDLVRECLALALADMPASDRQLLLSAGLEPESEQADNAREVFDDFLGSCGVRVR